MGSTRHVLFLSRPDENHRYPTLAVAEELGRRGHRVTFATGDPFAEEDAEAGVLLLRFGRDVRTLRRVPAFAERGPVDLVVCDPRTYDDAFEWGARVVVAHTNPPAGEEVDWPAQRAFGADHLYVHPAGRGTVFADRTPTDPRRVLAVRLDDPPAGPLAEAFGDWQLVSVAGPLDHADIVLTDGELPEIAASLRHAIPLVLAPRTLEQHRHAERIAALGLGVVVPPGELDAATLRRVADRLAVDEPAHAAARDVRALVRAAGSPARASDALEAHLAAGYPKAA